MLTPVLKWPFGGKDTFLLRLIWPWERREREIKEVMSEQIDNLYQRVLLLEESDRMGVEGRRTTEELVLETQWMLVAGVNFSEAELIRYVPVRIYLKEGEYPNELLQRSKTFLSDAAEIMARRIRVALSDEFAAALEMPNEAGSLFKRFWVKTRERAKQKDVESKVEAALELRYLDKPQAEATKALAESIATLLEPLKDVPNACIQIGNVLVVKSTDPNGKAHIAGRSLSAMDMKRLEQDRSLLQEPEKALRFLISHTRDDGLVVR